MVRVLLLENINKIMKKLNVSGEFIKSYNVGPTQT